MAVKRELPPSCVTQLACEELAGGLDAFARQNMTEARIEFRLDLETCSSQPFRRKPSLLRWNDGIILTVHQQDLGEVFSFRLGRSREPARSGDDGSHRPTPGRDSVERHDGALRKAEESDAVEPPGESMLLDFAGDHPIKRRTCVLNPVRTIGLGDAGDAEPLTSRTASVEPLWPVGRGKDGGGEERKQSIGERSKIGPVCADAVKENY
jgi:hypothetical protein